jgi:hypothetical protein
MTLSGTFLDLDLGRSNGRKTLFPALKFFGDVHAVRDDSMVSDFSLLEQLGNL